MAERVFTVVHDEGLYQGTGIVSRWFHRIGEASYANIKQAAPVRTGALRAGITLDFNRDGVRILSADVSSTAPHTGYVVRGTAGDGAGLIMSTRAWANKATVGRLRRALESGSATTIPAALAGDLPIGLWMKLSDARDGLHLVVHGQRHNNFLVKGYNVTARTHRSLKPLSELSGREGFAHFIGF